MRWRPFVLCVLAVGTGLLASCSLARVAYLEVLPLRGFQSHALDAHVYFEPGGEAAADAVAANLDAAVRQIEESHGDALAVRPDVYICATASCYQRYAFTFAARAETRPFGNTVLMQGSLLVDEHRLLPILTHELSHVFWFQRGIRCHPRWWTEGLAVAASGGGGAEMASTEAAVAAVRASRLFTKIDESCYVRDSAARAGLDWPMFYRQAGMFVGWLRERDLQAFERSLSQLRGGARLSAAIESAYGMPVSALWQSWRHDVESLAPP